MTTLKPSQYSSLLVALCFASCAQAYDISDNWHINGFIAQSAIHTDGNNFFGETENAISTDFFEAGLVLNGNITQKLKFSTQVLARKAGENDDGHPKIDYGFFAYDLVDNARWNTGFRLGRIPSQVGLYNATRDVPFTRPSILLPQSIYGETIRNSRFAHDGVQWYGEWRQELNRIIWHVDYYQPLTDGNEMDDIFLVPLPGDIDAERSWMSQLIYEWDGGTGRIALTYNLTKYTYQITGQDLANFSDSFGFELALQSFDIEGIIDSIAEIDPARKDLILNIINNLDNDLSFAQIIDSTQLMFDRAGFDFDLTSRIAPFLEAINISGDVEMPTTLLSTQYNWQRFTLSAEYMRRDIKTNGFDEFEYLNTTIKQEGYFAQLVYHLAPKWDLLLRHDRFYFNRNDHNGENFQKLLPGMPSHRAYAIDTTLGLSWHINSQFMTRFEWHNIEGTAWLPVQNNPSPLDTEKYWNMLALQIAFRF